MADLAIGVAGISKIFGDKKAVNNVTLQVKRVEVCGFLGPAGSGKTTTIRMVYGLLTPDTGQGHCLGYDIIKEADAIKRRVGYMAQHFSLYKDLTVYESLDFVARMYNMDNRKQRLQQAVDDLEIGKARQNQLAGNLSGGWKQRLSLAAAVLHGPKLLLPDEPTAGVDPRARRGFWDEIHRLSALGITTLVSAHYMDEAERCHRLAYIAYGNLLAHSTEQEVIASANIETWQVTGGDTALIAKELRKISTTSQVSAFGLTLHISAPLKNQLSKELQPFIAKYAKSHWQQITPGLEDVFIHFMQTQKDNFA